MQKTFAIIAQVPAQPPIVPKEGVVISLEMIVFSGVSLASGLTIGVVKWLIDRSIKDFDKRFESCDKRFENLGSISQRLGDRQNQGERELLELKATLPTEYVHRDDWIRFSNTIDIKIDGVAKSLDRKFEVLQSDIASLRQ